VNYIKELPVEQPPEIFGMHDNVDISKELFETKLLFDSVLITQKSAGGGDGGGDGSGGASTDDIAADILSKLPSVLDVEAALKKFPTRYEESMNTVLVQEMERFNRLLGIINSTLVDLRKAVKGLVLMSPDLEEVAECLAIGKVPGVWMKKSYPSLKPLGGYINDLLARIDMLQTWYHTDKPAIFWISGFFFTQAFLTGALQNYARKYKIPIDILGFDFEVMREEQPSPVEDGILINGLFLDGARWDREGAVLAEQLPKVLFETVPVIWLKPGKRVRDFPALAPLRIRAQAFAQTSMNTHNRNNQCSCLAVAPVCVMFSCPFI